MLEITRRFAQAINEAFSRLARGQPEEQLKRPTCELIEAAGSEFGIPTQTTLEIVAAAGRPDIGILTHGLLCGYVELKAPREEIDPARMRGRNRKQWEKFRELPNLIYTNGREWRLYRTGELDGPPLLFEDEPRDAGPASVTPSNAERLNIMLRSFLAWRPIVPTRPRDFARYLAPLTRILKQDVEEAVASRSESLLALRDEWRAYLFADVSDSEFADAYAQTVTYALLLARLEGADIRDAAQAEAVLRAHNSLLGRILRILTQDEVRIEIKLGLDILQRVLQAMSPESLNAESSDPWLYFYEDFLHAYDPALARDAGVYYTPVQVVRCQISLVSQLLEERFDKRYSFASEGVTVLDPAVGTGTYLVAAIQHALRVVDARAGAQRPARAVELAKNLIGFELLIGPYAVAHLRLSRELMSAAGQGSDPFHDQPLRIYLADTLESPAEPSTGVLVPLLHRPLVQERERARRVKADERVIVCVGNPPYDRQMEEGAARKGGWVRFGDQTQALPILEDFLEPARQAGQGVNLRSIYNDYVYFWRWALWKVFETRSNDDNSPGIVSFITGSSYLGGPGFVGMREHMRRCFDEIWIIDLGGDSLGTRREPNVFAIQTPVAIAIGMRGEHGDWETPARVKYQRLVGTRPEKLNQLHAINRFEDLTWRDCETGWQASFKPPLTGEYASWPSVKQIFPWQHNGAQFVRTWPIAPTRELLERRWSTLLSQDADGRRVALKETRDKTIEWRSERVSLPGADSQCLADLIADSACPPAIRYAYRSFDRQWALFDGRLGDYLKPAIWAAHGPNQVYLSTLLATAIGFGPAATFASDLPDLHHFRGSFGGKDLIPLFRDRNARRPNITSGLLQQLSATLRREVEPTTLFAYAAGILGGRAYTGRFWSELETPGVNLPITKSGEIFDEVVALGRSLVNLATFGDRFPSNRPSPTGAARIAIDIPHATEKYPASFAYSQDSRRLSVGAGVIEHVPEAVWDYEVSGLRVLESWLSYRMQEGAGRRSSPLDDLRPRTWSASMSEELLELIWTLETYALLEPTASRTLNAVLEGEIFSSAELPQPTTAEKKSPKVQVHTPQTSMGLNN